MSRLENIKSDNKVDFDFVANEDYTFPDRNIPNVLGFRGTETPFGIHIGNEEFAKCRIVVADYPYDLISGINLIFVYTDLIEYQNTGDVKAPILRVIDSGKCVENGEPSSSQGLERSFFDLQFKKLLVQNIQTISIQLRCETGYLVSFNGTGQVVLTLKCKNIFITRDYYAKQVYLPHFSSYNRQRGSGIGALAAGIGRVAVPFAKKFLLPAAKNIGKELLTQSVSEILAVIAKRKSPPKAAKKVLSKTIKKQIGGRGKQSRGSKKRKTINNSKRRQRSRSDLFSKVKNVA